MINIKNHTISENASILETLRKLNDLSVTGMMALFVEDFSGKVIGTITDGDIRRAILAGYNLEDCVSKIANLNFAYLEQNNIDVIKIRQLKKQGFKLIPILNGEGGLVKIVDLNHYNSYLPIDAVLMAGGKGERLRPMTLDTPKPLLKVGNKPIIDYNIDNLLKNGIENISVTVNYLKEKIEEHFSCPCSDGTRVKCVREPKFLGTMGAVKFIKDFSHDSILVMNSDLFTNIDLEDFYLHFKEHQAEMSVVAVPYSVNVPYGIFEIEGVREVKGVKEKPCYHYYANAGIYLIKRELIDLIPDDVCFNATDMIDLLIKMERKVIRFPLSGYWIDIGKPEDFNKVQDIAKHLQK